MPRSMPNPSDQEVLKTFSWYFNIVLDPQNQNPELNKCYSIILGRMISSLNMRCICALDNGEIRDFNPTAEYELVGRGLLFPLYRLNNSNDKCFTHLMFLHQQIESGYLETLKTIDSEKLKALAPYLLLLMNKYKNLLAKISIDFGIDSCAFKNLNSDDVVRNLSEKQCKDLYNQTLLPQAKMIQKNLIIAVSDDPNEHYKQNPKETLLKHLTIYIEKRTSNTREYYIPIFSKLFGGYSRTEKLAAAEALKISIQNPTTFFKTQHLAALKQGQLNEVINAWETRSEQLLFNMIKVRF